MKEKDIKNVILFQIDKTSKISKQYFQREFDKANLGITIEQWGLLKIIQESEGTSQKSLAEQSLRDPASITRTLDILQKKKFIIREPIEQNRRQHKITLTKNGANFVEKNMNMVNNHRKKGTEGFTKKELKTLNKTLKKIQKNMI